MKKILTFCSTILFALSVNAIEIKEGVHYTVISENVSSEPQITEYFSFYCPHCYGFEPLIKKLKVAAEESNIKFQKNHVDFMRQASPEFQFKLAKAQIISEKLNKPEIIKGIFESIHVLKKPVKDESDLRSLFEKHGVEQDKFDSLFNSFSVESAARKMKIKQEELTKKGVLKGVPTIIVNGKYMITPQGFKIKTYEELYDGINDAVIQLIQK